MSPDEFTKQRESLGLSPTELAKSLGVTYQAIKDWQSGRRKISLQVIKQLDCLARVKSLELHIKQRQSDA
ncbi:helix-turn-helix domain-containing protein [Shewanella baltica]|uniref:helix-turn-helix domain-containing protein n=1 Tax=Shewanella baltica TaxID=62322 RepID=UPI003D792725